MCYLKSTYNTFTINIYQITDLDCDISNVYMYARACVYLHVHYIIFHKYRVK